MEHITSPRGDDPAGISKATLANLDALDGADKTSPGGAPGGATPAPDHTTRDQLLAALRMARAAAADRFKWWPNFAEVWADGTLQEIADAGADVMRLQGWTVGEFMGKYGPYVRLALAVGVPGWVTMEALRTRTVDAQPRDPADAASGD